MQLSGIIPHIFKTVVAMPDEGQIAQYIPELATIDPSQIGLHLIDIEGVSYGIGDHQTPFSVQSIIKVLAMTVAFQRLGDDLWSRVGVEPSGNPFNSLIQLEYEQGIPRNPLINSGALVIADILIGILPEPKKDFLQLVRRLANDENIQYNAKVAASEKLHGFRNAALVHFMKAYGNIHHDPEAVLDFYFHMCAIEMSCQQLAKTFLLFANHGLLPNGERWLTVSQTKRINAIMQLCGFYDEAGEFSFRVGLPGKSGVGGGIAAIHPGKYSVAVWSPLLNKKGNSNKGMHLLELLTTYTAESIF